MDDPWNLVKLDRVLNFFIYFYKLLKVASFYYTVAKYAIKTRYSNNLK